MKKKKKKEQMWEGFEYSCEVFIFGFQVFTSDHQYQGSAFFFRY